MHLKMHLSTTFKMHLKNALGSQIELLMRSLEDGIVRRFKEDIYSISNEFRPLAFYPTMHVNILTCM